MTVGKSLVEDMAGVIADALDLSEGLKADMESDGEFVKAATAALQAAKDRLPADDRELWGELWQLHRRGLSYASSVPAVNLLLADMAEGLLKAADRITALSASRDGWRPIETAPKDGTLFMAIATGADNRPLHAIVQYADRETMFSSVLADPPPERKDIVGVLGHNYGVEFTDWQPLPEPPKEPQP